MLLNPGPTNRPNKTEPLFMTSADRWLLPDGVEELLPEQALQVESLRRKLLDLYHSWGYELVIPPLIEFTESLRVGLGNDVDLQTFKVTDQLSGRTMGIRADITPQTARIDAHSLNREGPVRLCYASSVLHTRPKSLLASRSPIQLGAELYGDSSVDSDIEIICLMLETLSAAGIENITLDLGHVGIYKSLLAEAQLDDEAEAELFAALQRKCAADIDAAISSHLPEGELAAMLRALSQLNGDITVINRAKAQLANAPAEVQEAITMLNRVASQVSARFPKVALYFDLSELRGFHYHTGLVFAALAPGHGEAVANGGRYDHIGEVFGRARPATGFNTDLKALLGCLPAGDKPVHSETDSIFAATDGLNAEQQQSLWSVVSELRAKGERVVCGLAGQSAPQDFGKQLVLIDGEWTVS